MRLTLKQQAYRKMLLKQIHLSPRYINYYKDSRDEWQEFLKEHFGVTSSAKLSIDNLKELNSYLYFKKDSLKPIQEPTNNTLATPLQCKKIKELWCEWANDKSDIALLSWLGKKFKTYHLRLETISRIDAGKIIAVLKGFKR